MEIQTLILGAGAAGLFCAGRAGPGALVIDHADAPGEKIRISGGGRCNFTNLRTGPENFISGNRHFHKSALAGFQPADFAALVRARGIAYHEKTLGQLFCDGRSSQIVDMLLDDAAAAGAQLWLKTRVIEVAHDGARFRVALERDGRLQEVTARNLVVATGGKSIPKMGATDLGWRIAGQFGLRTVEARPGLVPFAFSGGPFADLAGLALPVRARAGKASFDEALLFTHRGLSGPAMLQISSYWREGEEISIDLAPGVDVAGHLRAARRSGPKRAATSALAEILPPKLVAHIAPELGLDGQIGATGDTAIQAAAARIADWRLKPTGTEGWRTAEVSLGGVDTRDLDSRTMAARALPGLFFIGECVDVTGWLGGYNFQWAWASAHAAAMAIRPR